MAGGTRLAYHDYTSERLTALSSGLYVSSDSERDNGTKNCTKVSEPVNTMSLERTTASSHSCILCSHVNMTTRPKTWTKEYTPICCIIDLND